MPHLTISLLYMYGMAAGCHSPVVVSGSDGNAFAGKSIETVIPKKYFFKHLVEIWGVLLYDKENIFGGIVMKPVYCSDDFYFDIENWRENRQKKILMP